jgi:hypothetical protein
LGKFGSFTVADVEINIKSKGNSIWGRIYGWYLYFTYDPTSYTSDEIDQFDEFMKNLKSQLVLILIS